MVTNITNGWRMEDVWLDKELVSAEPASRAEPMPKPPHPRLYLVLVRANIDAARRSVIMSGSGTPQTR
jgi:hypothetical protein